jgi:hypothetical protein
VLERFQMVGCTNLGMTLTPNSGASTDDVREAWIADWLASVCAP